MIAAASRPAGVRGVALISPWVLARPRRFPPRAVSDVLQIPLVGRPLARLAIRRMRRDPERRRAAYTTTVADLPGLTRDPAMAALLAEASDRLVHADVRAMADWAAGALALDVRPLAARLPHPALVVIGSEDRITRPPGASWLAQALPAGRLLRLDGVSHFPHLEAADRVLPALVEHLR
jgi:pimeloyl-ACP methyl ester carboxylesterase